VAFHTLWHCWIEFTNFVDDTEDIEIMAVEKFAKYTEVTVYNLLHEESQGRYQAKQIKQILAVDDQTLALFESVATANLNKEVLK
jgi:hypothetical protein